CGSRSQFNKMSKQARGGELPHEAFSSYFLDVFDRPPRSSPFECARSNGASLSQGLHPANSPAMEDKIGNGKSRVARLVQQKTPPARAIEELYLAAYSRSPTPDELKKALAHVEKTRDQRRGLEDVTWALLNSREFLFNH